MKQKFTVAALSLSGFNLILFAVMTQILGAGNVISGIICLAISVIGAYLAFSWIMKPVTDMQKQLERSAEESRKAELIRSEFVANVTHELKTPLTSISGFIETLQDGAAEDPEIRAKFIDIIAIETARLKRLIEDLLVLSDIENKREQVNTSIDIKKSLEMTIEAIRPIAESRNIQIITDMEEGCFISGSEDRFRQMMVNLIENAIKYSNDGKKVFIKSGKENGKIVVRIKDEGIGIDKEHFDRLFERFYRVDKSRSKKEGGTGLGLSIVKHIAVLLDAELKVESQLGKGSEFFVIFARGAQ